MLLAITLPFSSECPPSKVFSPIQKSNWSPLALPWNLLPQKHPSQKSDTLVINTVIAIKVLYYPCP